MITTIYECDRCGHKQDNSEQMWEVVFGFKRCGDGGDSITFHRRKTALWCRKCLEELHFIQDPEKPHEVEKEPPTMEELFRQFVAEIAQEVVDESNS